MSICGTFKLLKNDSLKSNIYLLNISILGDIQMPSGYGPGQLAVGGPARAGGLNQMTSRGPF